MQLFSCFSYLEQLVDDLCRVGRGSNVETMGWLQLFGVFLDGQESNFSSASLHYIAEENSREMAQMLLVHKTYIEARKQENQTCSYITASSNSAEVAQLMLGRSKGIKARDCNEIPRHYVALHNSKEMEWLLLGCSVDIEAGKGKNRTAHHKTVWYDSTDVALLLLEHNKDIDTALRSRVTVAPRLCSGIMHLSEEMFHCIHPLLRYQHRISVKVVPLLCYCSVLYGKELVDCIDI